MLPDYRGGLSFSRRFGKKLFFETNADGIFVSRFGNDVLLYTQNRPGYAITSWLRAFWNANATVDGKGEYWANYIETGPGVGIRLPSNAVFSVSALRGVYTINGGNPRRPNFYDLRAGFWYAFTH
jgi:hypothetical protein